MSFDVDHVQKGSHMITKSQLFVLNLHFFTASMKMLVHPRFEYFYS